MRAFRGQGQPGKFDDRYDAALLELVKAKLEGRDYAAEGAPGDENLIEALQQSAGVDLGRCASQSARPPPGRQKKGEDRTSENHQAPESCLGGLQQRLARSSPDPAATVRKPPCRGH